MAGEAGTGAIARTLFAALVVATIASFVITQRLKESGLILDRVKVTRHITPNGDSHADVSFIRFRITKPDHDVDVQIVAADGRPVRTLLAGGALRSYHYYYFRWNGRSDSGSVAPRGDYRLRVQLHEQDRDLVPGRTIHLRRPPPRLHRSGSR
jgi:hypothetical protein